MVHNHGPREGPGLDCPEIRRQYQPPVGMCMVRECLDDGCKRWMSLDTSGHRKALNGGWGQDEKDRWHCWSHKPLTVERKLSDIESDIFALYLLMRETGWSETDDNSEERHG